MNIEIIKTEIARLPFETMKAVAIHCGIFITQRMSVDSIASALLESGQARKEVYKMYNDRRASEIVQEGMKKGMININHPTLEFKKFDNEYCREAKEMRFRNHEKKYDYTMLIQAIKRHIRKEKITNLRWETDTSGQYENGFRLGIVRKAA